MSSAVAPGPLDAFGPRSWTRPEATGFGREPMATALGRPHELSLDGAWSFVLRDRPGAVTVEDLVGPSGGWASVEVPGCWTMQGFDRPQFTNVQMPFPGPPPSLPEANPTGVHRRTVTVPEEWRGQRVVLHVGGAETVLYLVAADRTPHPSLLELAKVVQPVRISAVDGARGVLSVHNEHDFVDLSWLDPTWEVAVDGDVVDAGALDPLPDVAPEHRVGPGPYSWSYRLR
ncbi:MAG: sugar-binding domain-containing protein [Iamia sp.]